jgi:hypothetical protein
VLPRDPRDIDLREIALVAVLTVAIVVAMSWPLVTRLNHDIANDLGDPLLQAWQVAWGGHALTEQPSDYFQSNTFWPMENSLAFSDALIGYAPTGLIGSDTEAALVRYNLLFVFAYALAFFGAYLLARELGVGPTAALIAAAAFAYAPWRLAQNGHLHVISSGGIPLTLFLLARGYRRRKPWLILAGWLVAAWQVSLGFTLGLQLGYLLAVLGGVMLAVWLVRRRPALGRGVVAATLVGGTLLLAWTAVQARPYFEVADDNPQARAERGVESVRYFSPPPEGLLIAPAESRVWGPPTEEARAELDWAPEQAVIPGVTVIALALAGLVFPVYSFRLRIGLLIAAIVTGVLALGFRLLDGDLGYRFLYDHLPGWNSTRTPGRLMTLTTLALGLLAAAGAYGLIDPSRYTGSLRGRRIAGVGRAMVCVLAATAILLEGSGALAHPTVPEVPEGQVGVADPQMHLPSDNYNDLAYMFFSIEGFPRIINGTSGFTPPQLSAIRLRLERFPNPSTVRLLQRLGVRSVILHLDRAPGTPWENTATLPVDGLGITRTDKDEVVVYDIPPS